jgi:hypothetical protein
VEETRVASRSRASRIPVPLRRISVFALMPVLSTLSNLVLLPTISHTFGTAGWTSVVLGQGIGAAASVLCSLQWPTEGPPMVAREEAHVRQAILRASMRSRSAAFLVCVPLILVVIAIVQPARPLSCTLAAFGAALIGLSPAWYFIGIGRPSLLVWTEGVPRLVGNLIAFVLILVGLDLWTYPLIMVAVSLFTALYGWFFAAGGRRGNGHVWTNQRTRRSLRFAMLARGLDAGFSYIAGPLVAVLSPAAYPVFGACDRLGKVVISGLAVVPQGAAGWAAEPPTPIARLARVGKAIRYVLPLAGLVFVFLAVATPTLVHLLFGGTVSVGYGTGALIAGSVTLYFLGQTLFMAGLAPTDNADYGYRYLVYAFVLGLPGLVVGTLVAGADGALAGMLLSGLTLVALEFRRLQVTARRTLAEAAAAHARAPVSADAPAPEAGR